MSGLSRIQLLVAVLSLLSYGSVCGAPVDTANIDTESQLALICAGMRANVDAIQNYTVEVEERVEDIDQLEECRARITWASPGKFVAEYCSQTRNTDNSSDERDLPIRRSFDGEVVYRDVDFGTNKRSEAVPQRYVAYIDRGTASLGDLGALMECDPYSLTWQRPIGTEKGVEGKPVWEMLSEYGATGKVWSVSATREFDADGWRIEIGQNGEGGYYWIDEEHGYVPRIIKDRWTELRVEDLRRVEGVWFPTLIVNRSADPSSDKRSISVRVTSLAVNQDLEGINFRLSFRPDTLVLDSVRQTRYVVRNVLSVAILVGVLLAILVGVVLLVRWRRAHRSRGHAATPLFGE